MLQRAIRIFCACLSLMTIALVATAQTNLTAKPASSLMQSTDR
jgi:hypothetical protein